MLTEKMEAIIEEYSISYVNEENKVYTTPENGGQDESVKNYMRFVAVEDSQINLTTLNMSTGEADNSVDLKHSKDGITWTQYDFNPIPLAAGETLYLKGNNENGFSCMDMETGGGRMCTFGDCSIFGIPNTPSTGKFECHGNIMSLLYGDEFDDKTIIPSPGCFANIFLGCTNLITAPELPATTLANNCYGAMFRECSSLTTAPELPATTLAIQCYTSMFEGCASLTTTPELPVTTLLNGCYWGMFEGCTSLTTAPELPATTLYDNCYSDMFAGCASLTTAPELPATTLTKSCYWCMFSGCTNLTKAPKLPATTLAKNCYRNMFQGCTSLTTAPELPATTLAEYCYSDMFRGCTNLNHITMLATDISANYCLLGWVSKVSSTGTFVKHPDMTSLPTDTSGIPEGWTVEDAVL